MPEIVIVDTSILLNVFNVPGRNQDHDKVCEELKGLLDAQANLLLPIAAIIETGNHIANSRNGRRRTIATKFLDEIRKALNGDSPWVPIEFPTRKTLAEWMDEFPDHASRGVGMGDLSIIKDWEAACNRHGNQRVRIWSLDGDLQSYDRQP